MAELPIMPMYWDAYLGDTKHLSTIEHGAYLLLLGAMWRGGGSLPEDDEFLMRVTGLRRSQWHRMKPTIMAFMHRIAGGRFTQDKLLQTFDVVRTKRKKAVHAANAMWLKKKGLPEAFALRTLSERNAIQSQISTTPFLVQSPTPAKEQEGSAEKAEAAASPEPLLAPSSALLGTRLVRKAS